MGGAGRRRNRGGVLEKRVASRRDSWRSMENKYAVIAGRERGEFIGPFSLKAGMLKSERIPPGADPLL